MLKQGDILLIQNRFDPLGWLLRYYTKSEWNHVAWVLNAKEYISADGTGIKIRPIKRLRTCQIYKVKAIRLKTLSLKQISQVTGILKQRQCSYNYLKFLKNLYALKITKTRKYKIPTCALFIATALKKVNYKIFKKNLYYITPEDFNNIKQSYEVNF